MEKRNSKRLPATMKIFIYRNHIPVTCCDTRDIGLEGIFAITGPLVYKPNTVVSIQFDLGTSSVYKFFSLPAKVKYTNQLGMGLEFDSEDDATLNRWRNEYRRVDLQYIDHSRKIFDTTNRYAIPR